MYLPQEHFDYLNLMAIDRDAPHDQEPAVRVALLGFCTTSYYARVLRGLGTAAGFPVATYESEYNTVEQTLLESSVLHDFKPNVIVFVTAVQALRDRLLAVETSRRSSAARAEAATLVSQVKRAAQMPGVSVIVNELVVPYERAWGNLSSRIDGALPGTVAHINTLLRMAAQEFKNVFTLD